MKDILIKIIKSYQKIPGNFHSNCRFQPTCSNYMIEAIEVYGSFKGIIIGIKRILRCNPLNKKYGYDPVVKKEKKMKIKRNINILLICLMCFTLTGCFKSDSMEDIEIYTTVYPIEYITNRLYGEYSTISSIYPDGVNVNEYELTNKQIKDYSKSDLLIFNGLNEEKNYVTEFFKKNNKIKIIDSTASMEYDNRVEELWLNPSNFLMIAQNIKNGFDEYLTNHYIKNAVNENFEELKIEVSKLDATFTTIVENASNRNIIVSDDVFNFLTKYGFNIISLDEDTITDKTISQVKDLLNSGSSSTIFVLSNDEISNTVNSIIKSTNTEVTYLHNLSNINETERSDKVNYLTIMDDNIELIKKEIYK